MAIPDYQSIMLPLLKFASDGKEHSSRESINFLADEFSLTEDERKEMLPSGAAKLFDNRVGWATTYLKKSGLIKGTKRGVFKIAEQGKEVLSKNPERIDVGFLKRFPEFIEFQRPQKKEKIKHGTVCVPEPPVNPEEALETAFQELQDNLSSELLQTIMNCSPEFFERLVIDVLIKMGYGGSRKEAGQAIGRSGDGGIDGIIKEDKLGLDIIYVQAKRWQGPVGRPEIQKFAGALQGQRARKGIFITTSDFSKNALDYVRNIDSKIILIDGVRLSELMIEHNVGVSPVVSYEIKRIDSDYFAE